MGKFHIEKLILPSEHWILSLLCDDDFIIDGTTDKASKSAITAQVCCKWNPNY